MINCQDGLQDSLERFESISGLLSNISGPLRNIYRLLGGADVNNDSPKCHILAVFPQHWWKLAEDE